MANTDLMIDLETLATSNDAAIVTMAAIRFDPHADYSKMKVEDLPPLGERIKLLKNSIIPKKNEKIRLDEILFFKLKKLQKKVIKP